MNPKYHSPLPKQTREIKFHELRKILPYSPPMIFIDRVCDWSQDGWICVEKVISGADPLIVNHFPDGPAIAPGIMMLEMVGQAGVTLFKLISGVNIGDCLPGQLGVGVTSRISARFHRPVYVGETLHAKVSIEFLPFDKSVLQGILTVAGDSVAEVTIYAAQIPIDK